MTFNMLVKNHDSIVQDLHNNAKILLIIQREHRTIMETELTICSDNVECRLAVFHIYITFQEMPNRLDYGFLNTGHL